MKDTDKHDADANLGSDLVLTRITPRPSGGGTWVCGRVHGHRFEALVFADHAADAGWEIEASRVAKLWVQRIEDQTTVFSWDRGLVIAPVDDLARTIVDFLAAGIADSVYAE